VCQSREPPIALMQAKNVCRSQREYSGDDPLEARPANLGVDKDSVRIDVQMNEFRLIVQE